LARLPGLHETIISEVLKDEDSRPIKLVTEASHYALGGYRPEDIRIWLETIRDGFSPVLATGELDSDGHQIFQTHDYADFHTASNLLWGRKTQARVTKAATYELQRRQDGIPPLDSAQEDGVHAIDALTCSQYQIALIDYAMHAQGASPKERMLQAWQEFESFCLFNGPFPKEHAAISIVMLDGQVSDVEDFNQWYESNGSRLATPEEKNAGIKRGAY